MTSEHAEPGQPSEIDAVRQLRDRFMNALRSGEREDLAPLITPDYVYYQPNYEGPCTYGRQPHLDYVRSLPKVMDVEIRLVDHFLMGRWAFESGEEVYSEDDGAGGSVRQVARFVRLLYRDDQGTWMMARTMRGMALDQHSYRRPPTAKFITNSGKGNWQPMPIAVDAVYPTECLRAEDAEGQSRLAIRDREHSASIAQTLKMDAGHVFVGIHGNYTYREEDNYQSGTNRHQYDELNAYDEDARVIVVDKWAYTMGKQTGVAIWRDNGIRRSGVALYFYLWKRTDLGRDPWPWKIHTGFKCDLFSPIHAASSECRGKSNVVHRLLTERWANQAPLSRHR